MFRLKLFNWNITKETWGAFSLGAAILFLSALMIPLKNNLWLYILDRDILMVLIAGIAVPLFLIARENKFEEYGLHTKKWFVYILINLILGILLLFLFLKDNPPDSTSYLNFNALWSIVYIMLIGVFEVIVFYSFLRTIFEKSFGIIPAIILTALFYSLHHFGFQPEFVKLFFVGIMYAVAFRWGNSALLIYPFFWGVGASYDVLIQSKVAGAIVYPEIRSIILITGFIVMAYIYKNYFYSDER